MARKKVLLPCVSAIATFHLCIPLSVWAAPLSLTKEQDLAFGNFVASTGTSGSVTINSAGVRSTSGGVTLFPTGGFSAARFTIRGNPGVQYSLSVPSGFTMSSAGTQMTVTSLSTSIPTTGVLPSAGSLSFTMGGTLAVGATQRTGAYSGTFSVSIGK